MEDRGDKTGSQAARSCPDSEMPVACGVSKQLKAEYDDYYDAESQWRWISSKSKADRIIQLCSKYPHNSILDVGAGEGSVVNRLSDRSFGESLHALEISSSGIESIRQRNIPSLKDCRLFDGNTIPYEDNRFDLVILSHVVEHLEYPRQLLYESARVGRNLFVEVPLDLTARLKKDYKPVKGGHLNYFSPKTIRLLVQTCHLQVLDQKITNPSWPVYRYRLGRKGILRYLVKACALLVCPGMATALWTYHCSLVCTKTDS